MGNGGLNFGKIYALCANFFIIINIYVGVKKGIQSISKLTSQKGN